MFLDSLIRRNRPLIEAAARLHREGRIPANSYVLDLDTMAANARLMADEAARDGLTVYAMTKQFGRNPPALAALARGGIDRFVAVDMADARALARAGARLGHIGHLTQVPRAEAAAAAAMHPEFWTVFSDDKAAEAAGAAAALGRTQDLLARIHAPGDRFYPGHEGGFPADEVVAVAERLNRLPGARFTGITTFPALLFDAASGEVQPTSNLSTLTRAAALLARAGAAAVEINAPGTTSSTLFGLLASVGVTQVEPGHGLTGTTPLHAMRELPEAPAMLYLTETSHRHGGHWYCFGGGLYVDPVFGDYPVTALAGADPATLAERRFRAVMPAPGAIDYYGRLEADGGPGLHTGDTVIFGFRAQAFVTRAFVVPVAGAGSGAPRVEGVWTADGRPADWPDAAPA